MDLERFLTQFSKSTLALVIIGGGILFIVLSDPPRDICDSQVKIFNEQHVGFLYRDKTQKMIKKTGYQERYEHCYKNGRPGACYELFMNMKVLLDDVKSVNRQCVTEVAKLPPVKKAVTEVSTLLVTLAWISNQHKGFGFPQGWLDEADMNLFCRLKRVYQHHYGAKNWERFQEGFFKSLPGVEKLKGNRSKIWDNMIFKINCDAYI